MESTSEVCTVPRSHHLLLHHADGLTIWNIMFKVTTHTHSDSPQEVKVNFGVFGLDESPKAPKEVWSLQKSSNRCRECVAVTVKCVCVCLCSPEQTCWLVRRESPALWGWPPPSSWWTSYTPAGKREASPSASLGWGTERNLARPFLITSSSREFSSQLQPPVTACFNKPANSLKWLPMSKAW